MRVGVSEVDLQSDEQSSTDGIGSCLPVGLGIYTSLAFQSLNSIAPSLRHSPLRRKLKFSHPIILSFPDSNPFYSQSSALHQNTHKPLSLDKNIKMRLSTMPLLSAALFLSKTSALPMNAVSADDCHQGLYCGSWNGQAALVLISSL